MNRIFCLASAFALIVTMAGESAAAPIGASGGGGPSASTNHNGNIGGFTIVEDVFFDASAGPWSKNLTNTGSEIFSGQRVPITETFTNVGSGPWTDWYEEVVGPVENFGFGPATEFAFERDSLSVFRNGVLLNEGPDYALVVTLHPVNQPGGGGPGVIQSGQHWQSMSIEFAASSFIQPSDILTIEKNIFETFLNGKTWTSSLVAEIEQYPTVPEPTTLVYVLAAIAVLGRPRRAHRC